MAPATPHQSLSGNQRRHVPPPTNDVTDNAGHEQTLHQPRVAARHLREIPDSQEDPTDFDLSDIDDDDLGGYESEGDGYQTEEDNDPEASRRIVLRSFIGDPEPPVPEDKPKTEPPYTLHKQGINCNGRLAAEHPDNADMEEEAATQEATQPVGYTSISKDDEADVICILHPSSKTAHTAVEVTARQCPQHILQNAGLDYELQHDIDDRDGELQYDIDDRGGDTRPDTGSQESQVEEDIQLSTNEANVSADTSAKDIALRISSVVHNPCLGFTFGRNPHRCDIPLAPIDALMKISNAHFRVYITSDGVLMVEDTSTNGTWVDRFELRANKDPKNPQDPKKDSRRTINQGSIIYIVHDKKQEPIRFVVGIPSRDRNEELYRTNLDGYLRHVGELERQAAVAAQAKATGHMMPPPLPFPLGQNQQPAAATSIPAQTFAAGTLPFMHGMGWNGGDTYNIVAHIGKGAFANVYKMSTKANGDVVAAKEIEKRKYLKDGILDRKVHNEIEIMQKVKHENIVKYHHYKETRAHLYIIMEFVPCGDLTPHTDRRHLLTERQCQSVAYQTMRALDYLHKNNITHRDIKPDNILIASNEPMVVKLSDFGLSKVVTSDDTFLKTFCGTLLYCAPEIYPGYENVKRGLPAGKRGRDDPQPQTLPYQQSVDTWAFAAVMFHLLCGHPPYLGSGEHKGQSMLTNVMTKPVDWDLLKRQGISAAGIDFVKRMLVQEPSGRASDAQCLRHPWLAHLYAAGDEDVEMDAEHGGLPVITEDAAEEQELDASQLSLHDQHAQVVGGEDELEYDEGEEVDEIRQSKRVKTEASRAMGFEPNESIMAQESQAWESDSTVPMFLDHGPSQFLPHPGQAADRLFGEIGQSALGSSGVFGRDADAYSYAALSFERSRDEGVAGGDTDMDDSSVDEAADSHVTNDGIAEHSLQYPYLLPATTYAGPAPSLMGAEALVGQLNMASPESAVSVPSADSKSATPRTPTPPELSPAVAAAAGSKRPMHDDQPVTQHGPIKRSKAGATPDPLHDGLPQDASAASNPPKAVGPDVSRTSSDPFGMNPVEPQSNDQSSSKKTDKPHRSHRASSSKPHAADKKAHKSHHSRDSTSSNPHGDGAEASKKAEVSKEAGDSHRSHRSSSRSKSKDEAGRKDRDGSKGHKSKDKGKEERPDGSRRTSPEKQPVGVVAAGSGDKGSKSQAPKDAQEKESGSSKPTGAKTTEGNSKEPGATEGSQGSSPGGDDNSSIPQPEPKEPGFIRPPPIFGKLTTLPHSIISTTVKLTQRANTYGRGEDCTVRFPNVMDDRVPRYAMDILFWRSGIERDIAKGFDWTKDESIIAIIATRTDRNHIFVNGTKLKRGADCYQYGKLYTGDIITVFDEAAEEKSKGTEFLKFECSFNIGLSKNRRPENEPFTVEQERDKYQKAMTRKSRQAARENAKAASSSKDAANAPATSATPAPASGPASAPAEK